MEVKVIPKEIHWEITSGCNLRCKTCLIAAEQARPDELTTFQSQQVLAKISEVGITKVCFTGGEPFNRLDFIGLLQKATELNLTVEVITNGTLTSDEVLLDIKPLVKKLGISLDGPTKQTNDLIRGEGSFNKTVKAIKLCRKLEIPVQLYITVSQQTAVYVPEIIKLANKLGCQGVHFNEVTLRGRATENGFKQLSLETRDWLKEIISDQAGLFVVNLQEDETCWADGSSLYLNSAGFIYLCSEIALTNPAEHLGNIISDDYWLKRVAEISQPPAECCFGTLFGKGLSFLYQTNKRCWAENSSLNTLEELYCAFDGLYNGIEESCNGCTDPDCLGYIWLLEKEAEKLFDLDIPVVRINNNIHFISSFEDESGKLDISKRYPICSQVCTGDMRFCSIHQNRPLVCHMYPIGLETTSEGKVVWVFHLDCRFTQKILSEKRISQFTNQFTNIINRVDPNLIKEILTAYKLVDRISKFPDGENKFIILMEANHVKV